MEQQRNFFSVRLYFSALCFIIILLSTFSMGSSYAQEEISGQGESRICTAVDLVIVIDQSGSMFDANDKNGRRFEAAKTIINYLGNHAVWLCAEQGIQHRVAVIGFGDRSVYVTNGQGQDNPYTEDINIYLPPTKIPMEINTISDTQLRETWKVEREENITPLIFSGINDNLNATDHRSGLLGARDILQEWREDPLPGIRRQSVIIITDGEPCLFWRGCDNLPPGAYYNIRPDLSLITDLTNRDRTDFPFRGDSNSESVFISILLLSQRNQSFTESFLDAWRDIAESHGGTLEEASTAPRLSPLIADMLQPIVQSNLQSVTCGQSFWITPYANNLTFLYAFALLDDEDVDVKINISSNGEQIEVQQGVSSSPDVRIVDYVVDGQNASYVFAPPLPGEYRLEVSGVLDCADVLEVKVESLPVSGEVIIPSDSSVYPATPQYPFYNEQIADKFHVAVTDNSGNPLQEFPSYPLLLDAVITSADGTHEQRLTPTDFIKLEDGVYESKQFIQTPVPGSYEWELVASVKHPDPTAQPLEVFRKTGDFTANEVAMFGFALEQPIEGDIRPLNTVQESKQQPSSIPVLVSMVDDDGNPLTNRTEILRNLREPFEARLYNGSTLINAITLQVKPGSSYQFVGEFTNMQNGAILPPGVYTIDVEALWDRDDYDPLNYAPLNRLQSVNITQYEVVPLSVIVAPPPDMTLHEDDWRANMLEGGRLKPFAFHVEILNALNGETVRLADVLTNPTEAIQVAIVPPSGVPIPVSLTPLANENFQRFVTQQVGVDIAEEGSYQLKLQTGSLQLQEGYGWAQVEATATFSREDTIRTTPSTWRGIAVLSLVLFLILLTITGYFWTGGPSGRIEIISNDDKTTYVSKPLKRFPRPRRNRLRHKWLLENNIKYLIVRKARPTEDKHKRAVHVKAVGSSRGVIPYETMSPLHPDEKEEFFESMIVYK